MGPREARAESMPTPRHSAVTQEIKHPKKERLSVSRELGAG